jgi:hypothetical protein
MNQLSGVKLEHYFIYFNGMSLYQQFTHITGLKNLYILTIFINDSTYSIQIK